MKKTFLFLLVMLACFTTMRANDVHPLRTLGHETSFQQFPRRVIADEPTVLSGDYADNLYWSLDAVSGVLTISGNGPMINNPASAAEIPWWGLQYNIHEVHIENGVTSVGGHAFQYCENLTSVSLPNTIDSIAEYAFSICSNLEHISIPQSVKKIGSGVFWRDVSLQDLVLPNNLSEIPYLLCDSCVSLTHVTLPQGAKLIDRYAFAECVSLTNVVIPDSVERINYDAFYSCVSLDSLTIGESVQLIENYAFYQTNINYIEWNAIRCADFYSEDYAPFYFSHCYFHSGTQRWYIEEGATQLVFGNHVERIPAYLMQGRANYEPFIPTITIPESVVEVNNKAIRATNVTWNAQNCKSVAADWNTQEVTTLHFGNQVKYIPQNLFSDVQLSCSILQIPQSVDTIGENAFKGTWRYWFEESTIESVNYQGSVDQWSHIVFKNVDANPAKNRFLFCNYNEVTDVVLTGLYDYVGDYAFYDIKGLTSLSLAEGIKKIGDYAFYNCTELAPVALPLSIEHIGASAFWRVNIGEILRLPNVKTIGEDAFFRYLDEYSNNIKSIWIGSHIEKLGCDAFSNVGGLEEFIIEGQPEFERNADGEYFSIAVLATKNLQRLKCPAEFLSYPYEDGVVTTELLESAITNQLDSIVITSGELSYAAFQILRYSGNSLRTLDLASAENTSLPNQSFKDCQKLTTLLLPTNLTAIPSEMVNGCLYMKSILIPASVTAIGDRAFENCRSLSNLQFAGNSLTYVGNWAFYNGHALENLTIPEGVTEIGDGAFYGCSYMDELTLPSTLYRIGDNTFGLCTNLMKISTQANIPPILSARTFHMVNRQIPVYVPRAVVADYQSNAYWSEFNITTEEQNPTSISDILGENETIRKVMINGEFYIVTSHGTFNVTGQRLE